MLRKRFFSLAAVLFAAVGFLTFGEMQVFASQMSGMQMPAASQTDQSERSPNPDMINHQNEMQALVLKLDKSFQAVVDAKDANGYVRDKAIVKAHEADITELRNAIRNHKLFLTAYESQCGVKSKQQDAMIEHQQRMKGVLYDVVDTFAAYQSADDSTIEASEPIEHALDAHRDALKNLADATAEHQKAMAEMMKRCH